MAFSWLAATVVLLLAAYVLYDRWGIVPAQAPLTACCGVALVVLLGGFAGILRITALALWLFLVVVGALFVIRSPRKALTFFLSPAMLAFTLGAVGVGLFSVLKPYFFVQYDDFSHWGPFFRMVFDFDRFHIWHDFETWHPSYPQGVQAFYYFTSVFSGRFFEEETYAAMAILYSASTVTMFGSVTWKKPVSSVLVLLAAPLFYVLFPVAWPYITLYQDVLLGALFGAGLVCAFCSYGTGVSSWLPITAAATFVAQVKATGWMFALIVLAVYWFRLFVDDETDIAAKWKKWLRSATVAMGGVAVWNFLLQISGRAAQELFSAPERPPLTEMLRGALSGENAFAASVLERFGINLVYQPVVYNGYGTAAVMTVLLVLGCAAAGVLLWLRRKEKAPLLIGLAMPVFLAAYCLVLLVFYLVKLSDYEALVAASMDRYMATFFIGWIMLALVMLFRCAEGRLLRAGMPLALLALCALQINILLQKDVMNLVQTRENAGRVGFDTVSAQMAEKLQPEDRVWVVGCGLDSMYQFMFHHTLMPAEVTLKLPISHGKGFPESLQEMRAELESHQIDYIVVYTTDERFDAMCAAYFSDGLEYVRETALPCLYRVEEDGTFSLQVKTVYPI